MKKYAIAWEDGNQTRLHADGENMGVSTEYPEAATLFGSEAEARQDPAWGDRCYTIEIETEG